MTWRRLLFWGHLSVGVVVGLVVVLLAATGSIIAFQTEIISLSERGHRIQQPLTTGCVQPSDLMAAGEKTMGGHASALILFADPHRPAEVLFGRRAVALMDPCRGSVIAAKAGGLRYFLWQVRDLHQAVALKGVRHETLRAVKNALNLAFLFLLVSGVVLWIPRKMSWQHFKPAVLLRRSAKGRAFNWNLHNVAGIWMALPLILISATGTILAYPWANGLLYRAAGERVPQRAEREEKDNTPLEAKRYGILNAAIVTAKEQDGGWKSLEVRVPLASDKSISVNLETGSGRPQERVRVQVKSKTGTVGKVERFEDNTRARKWRTYARYLHTGELFGVAGKAVAFMATLAALLLVWTGFALSYLRWKAWVKKRIVARDRDRALQFSNS